VAAFAGTMVKAKTKTSANMAVRTFFMLIPIPRAK